MPKNSVTAYYTHIRDSICCTNNILILRHHIAFIISTWKNYHKEKFQISLKSSVLFYNHI